VISLGLLVVVWCKEIEQFGNRSVLSKRLIIPKSVLTSVLSVSDYVVLSAEPPRTCSATTKECVDLGIIKSVLTSVLSDLWFLPSV